jgi:hypothetical protein
LRVTAHSEPGSPDKPNEDAIVISVDTVAVLDGATARTDTGCIHGVAWFVRRLAEALVEHSDLTASDSLASAISETAGQHRGTCDLEHPGAPSAALGIVQARDGVLRYLLLGDVTLAIERPGGSKCGQTIGSARRHLPSVQQQTYFLTGLPKRTRLSCG